LEKTPDLYNDQLEASTQIETGPEVPRAYLTSAEDESILHGLAEFKYFLAVGMLLQDPWTAV
jgi:hypothetical protein